MILLRFRLAGWRSEFLAAWAAAMALTVALLAAAVTYGVYTVRADADAARVAIVDEGEVTPTTTGVTLAYDDVPGEGQFSVVTLHPGGPDAPLPPGLIREMSPGDVALSPALHGLPASELIHQRYGRVVTTIGEHGLGAPDEKLAYVIGKGQAQGPYVVSRFGGADFSPWQVASSSATFGESTTIKGLNIVLPGVLGLISVPALALAVAASRRGSTRRATRDMVLEALGAPSPTRHSLRLLSALPGTALGSISVTALAFLWVQSAPTVPYVDFVVSPQALSPTWAVLITLAGAALSTALVARVGRRPWRSTRPARLASAVHPSWLWAGPVAVAAATWIPEQVGGATGLVYSLLRWILAAVSIPAVGLSVGAAVALVGTSLHRLGNRRASASLLIAGSSLRTGARAAAMTTVALGVLCGIAYQSAQIALATQAITVDARIINDTVGPSVALVDSSTEETTKNLIAQQQKVDIGVIAVSQSRVTGDCDDLRRIGLACGQTGASDARGRAVLRALGLHEHVPARDGEPPPVAGQFIVVSKDARPVDVPALKAIVHQGGGQLASVGPVASWTIAGDGAANEARWVVVWANVGLALGLAGLLLTTVTAKAQHGRRLAPVLALFGPRRARTAVTASIMAAFPLLLGGVAAVLTHHVEALSLLGRIRMPDALNPLTSGLLVMVVLGTIVATGITTQQVMRAAERWLPGRDR